jgi:hypothetical protein
VTAFLPPVRITIRQPLVLFWLYVWLFCKNHQQEKVYFIPSYGMLFAEHFYGWEENQRPEKLSGGHPFRQELGNFLWQITALITTLHQPVWR